MQSAYLTPPSGRAAGTGLVPGEEDGVRVADAYGHAVTVAGGMSGFAGR